MEESLSSTLPHYQLFVCGLSPGRSQRPTTLMATAQIPFPIIKPMWSQDSFAMRAMIMKNYPMIRTTGTPCHAPLLPIEGHLICKAKGAILKTTRTPEVSTT